MGFACKLSEAKSAWTAPAVYLSATSRCRPSRSSSSRAADAASLGADCVPSSDSVALSPSLPWPANDNLMWEVLKSRSRLSSVVPAGGLVADCLPVRQAGHERGVVKMGPLPDSNLSAHTTSEKDGRRQPINGELVTIQRASNNKAWGARHISSTIDRHAISHRNFNELLDDRAEINFRLWEGMGHSTTSGQPTELKATLRGLPLGRTIFVNPPRRVASDVAKYVAVSKVGGEG